MLLVTHEPDEAMRMADEIALMRGGRIVQRGAPYNVYNAPVDRAAAAFFSDINVIRGRVARRADRNAVRRLPDPRPCRRRRGGYRDPAAASEDRLRPGRARPEPDAEGRHAGARHGDPRALLGRESLVDFRMDFDGSKLTASVPGVFLPKPGTALWLMIRRDRCFVFPASRA